MARHTERGLDRLVNFSDATVAIALTLLILPLADLAGEVGRGGLGPLLSEHVDTIVAFLLSFAVIASMWLEHHRLFEELVDFDTWLIVMNLLWLFALVVLPFSTSAVESSSDRVAVGLYVGNLFFGFAMIPVMRLWALRHRELIHPERRNDTTPIPTAVLAGLAGIAFIISLVAPGLGLWALFLMVLTAPISRLLGRPRRSR